MMHIAICDDEQISLKQLTGEVEEWAKAEQEACRTENYTAADAFLFAWEEKKDIDVLLLDIEMPGMDGIALARKLRRMGERISIIFVTGNPDFALEGYELEAVFYLVKPLKREKLWAALNRAKEQLRRRPAILAPLSAGEVEKVYVSDICCLESDGHDSIVWKRDGTKVVCKTGLLQMEQELSECECQDAFFKPHRSYDINLGYVERIGKKEIRMENKMLVPVARGKWEALNQAYMRYFRKQSF